MSKRTVALRIVVSALFGIGVASVFFFVDLAYFQLLVIHNDYWFSEPRFWEVLERSAGVALLGVIVTSPLVAIAVLTGIVFRRSVTHHTGLWTLGSPTAVWIFVCVTDAFFRGNPYFQTHGAADRLRVAFTDGGNLLFLVGPAVAALSFYLLSRPSPSALKRAARSAIAG